MRTRKHTDTIVVHCSYTPPNWLDGKEAVDEIRRWHTDRRWDDIGYHFIIDRKGAILPGRAIEMQGAHAPDLNARSIAICLLGGKAADDERPEMNFTRRQFSSLLGHLGRIKSVFMNIPNERIVGHHDVDSRKACPCFDVQHWLNNQEAVQKLRGPGTFR